MRYVWILVAVLFLAACSQGEPQTSFEDLPAGDAQRGADLFANGADDAPACITCHTLDGNNQAGPSVQGYASRAGSRVEGQSAEEYTYRSIVRVSAHVVSGYSNVMPNDYEEKLSAQQLADLVAYLLTL